MVVKKKKSKSKPIDQVGKTAVASPQTGSTQPSSSGTVKDEPLSPDTEKILAALSYPIWIIALVLVIIAKPANKFGKFHGYQALFFGIAWWVIYLVLSAFTHVPFIGWLFSVLSGLVGLGFFIVSILYAVQAYQGKTFKVPVVYGLVPTSARM